MKGQALGVAAAISAEGDAEGESLEAAGQGKEEMKILTGNTRSFANSKEI